METYTINIKKNTISYGTFKDLVYEDQKNEYGEESAEKNLRTAYNILYSTLNSNLHNKNILLVGKVQSGKTSNLEMLSALAFDNGFNLLIIYGGYDKTLLKQSYERFMTTFHTESEGNYPYLFTTDNDLSDLDNTFINNAIEENRPVIICCMKRPVAIKAVNDCLSNLNSNKIKAFIIDDEGDQASLNTKKNSFINDKGENEGSTTYQYICQMKKILNDPYYFSVTATPEANIFQPEISALMPGSVHLIYPANLYTGADSFHVNTDAKVKVIKELNDIYIDQMIMPDTLKKAIQYYIIASALMLNMGKAFTNMIIHSYREIESQKKITTIVQNYIDELTTTFKNHNDDDISFYLKEFRKVYSSDYFTQEVIDKYNWNSDIELKIRNVIKKGIKVIMKNSSGNNDETIIKHFKYKIYIGGDLLQRGITFKNLICTFFTRWATTGNMDTNLQRARWFGYRSDYLDLCKIFTTKEIKQEFTNLGNIENDLWTQFAMAENNEIKLEDIVIDANDTSLNPTRGNVANYSKTSFGKLWINQFYITENANEINNNNIKLEALMMNNEFVPTEVGRLDGNISAYYSLIESEKICEFIDSINYIFDQTPFKGKENLKKAIKNYTEVCIEYMFGEGLNLERHRTFLGNKISALQQGADSVDEVKRKYKGDAYVVARDDIPCIQVFNILPEYDGKENRELKQYMYSIHFPIKKTVYSKK